MVGDLGIALLGIKPVEVVATVKPRIRRQPGFGQDVVGQIQSLAAFLQVTQYRLRQFLLLRCAMRLGLKDHLVLVDSQRDRRIALDRPLAGRHLAAWLGITPRESSSGHRRQLGRITKRGDVYLRMLIIYGARSVLARAKTLARSGTQSLSRLHRWALKLEQRIGHNKAAVALANKLARIAWAMWRYDRDFDGNFADTQVAA